MINIAICISGEPRKWQYCVDSIKILREKLQNENVNLDVFFYFWDEAYDRGTEQTTKIKNKQEITDLLEPASFKWLTKDSQTEKINRTWEFINQFGYKLRENYNSLDKLQYQVKHTNAPALSQMWSICEAQLIRTEYEKKHNILYDIVIKTRTDIEFSASINKIKVLVEKGQLYKSIQFPKISIRKKDNLWGLDLLIYLEYCFFMSSSKILTENIFENYVDRVNELTFNPDHKNKRIVQYDSHNVIPHFLRQNTAAKFDAPNQNFKYKIHQI